MKHSLNKGTAKESILANFSEQQNLEDTLNNKQNKLVSGTNIKTINGNSLLGSGDIETQDKLVSGTNIKTINGNSVLGSGDITIEGGGGNAEVFVDVDSLPTENIDSGVIYRVKGSPQWYEYSESKGLINYNDALAPFGGAVNIIQVSSLPESPEIFMNQETYIITAYLMGSDIYGYNATGDNTWLSNSELLSALGAAGYGGVITSLDTTNLVSGYHYIYLSLSYINVDTTQFEFSNKEDISILSSHISTLENNISTINNNLSNKQDTLISNTNIKTINGNSLLGSGDIVTPGVGWNGTGGSSEIFNCSSNIALGLNSHAEGYYTAALGGASHVEGIGKYPEPISTEVYEITATNWIEATCDTLFSVGDYLYISESASFTTGVSAGVSARVLSVSGTEAPYTYTFSLGNNNSSELITGHVYYARRVYCGSVGDYSHAEGRRTTASGYNSHAEGNNTIAASENQHVQGKYNIEDSSNKYAHIVGNGSVSARSNAHTLDWSGNAWFKGNVRVGGTSWDDATELGSGGGGSSEWSLIHTVTGGASDGGNIIFEGLNLDTNYNDYIFELSASFISVLSYTKKLATDDIIYQLNTYLIDLSWFGGASMSLCYLAYAYDASSSMYNIIIQFYDSGLQPITDNAGVNQLATVLKLNIYAK